MTLMTSITVLNDFLPTLLETYDKYAENSILTNLLTDKQRCLLKKVINNIPNELDKMDHSLSKFSAILEKQDIQ